jgi:hypothetical protein
MPKRVTASAITPSTPVNRRRHKHQRDADEAYHHHWSRENKIDIHREDQDYEIVQNSEGGPVTSGGDVLMRCRREGFEARVSERKKRAVEQRRGPMESFKMQGLRHGVPVIDLSRERQGSMASVLGDRE